MLAADDKRAYRLGVKVVALLPHRLLRLFMLHQNYRISSLTTSSASHSRSCSKVSPRALCRQSREIQRLRLAPM
jgi:hypothetical protein